MDFVMKKCIFLVVFFCLASAFDNWFVPPFLQNKVLLAGATDGKFTCASTKPSRLFGWFIFRVGSQYETRIKRQTEMKDPDFDTYDLENPTESHITAKTAKVSTAGVYICELSLRQFAQVIVVIQEAVVNISPKPTDKSQCDAISQLTCSMKYAANSSYVVPNIKWSSGDSSDSLTGTMSTSTADNVTTATSTLAIAEPKKYSEIIASNYRCNASFSLVNNLPTIFANNTPDYSKIASPQDNTCDGKSDEKTTGKPNENPSPKPNENPSPKPNENPSPKPNENPSPKPNENPSPKPNENPSPKPNENPSPKPDTGKDEEGKDKDKSDGTSVGSLERNIVVSCVSIVTGLLLIG